MMHATDTAADLAATYATIDRLCAEALERLPSLDAMLEVALALLPGAEVDFALDRPGHAGDSLAAREVAVQTSRLRLCLSADWLDRRDHYGAELGGDAAPRGFYDVRLHVVDRGAEMRYYASRKRRKSRREFGCDVAEAISRGERDAAAALRAVAEQVAPQMRRTSAEA